MVLPILFFIFSVTTLSAEEITKVFYNLEEANDLFENFIQTYNKVYSHSYEKEMRLAIFKQNLNEINRLNSLDGATFAINEFADLTVEEMRRYYMGLAPREGNFTDSACQMITDGQIRTHNLPDTLDYRQNAVTKVKNQGKCQVCWIFATIGTVEGAYALQHSILTSFSEQQLMNCLKCSGGCNQGGLMVNALSELIQTPGIMTEAEYPFTERDEPCRQDQTRAMVRVSKCFNFYFNNENSLKGALVNYGPIAIAINGDAAQYYRGGIYSKSQCPESPLNHAVLLVGYGNENGQDYWIIKNSWGPSYGENGFMRISRGQNTCGLVNNMAASAKVA